MADGEANEGDPAEDLTGRVPLPPADRLWRHPAEVAMEARRQAAAGRARRQTALLVVGAAVAVGLFLVVSDSPDVRATAADAPPTSFAGADLAETGTPSTIADAAAPTTASLRTTAGVTVTAAPGPETTTLEVRLDEAGEVIGAAILLRKGYAIAGGASLADAGEVLITWRGDTAVGTVIGYDDVTEIAVIRIATPTPIDTRRDADPIAAGDTIRLAEPSAPVRRVVDPTSASARDDGEPVVGIVELDGVLGEVPPGSPAFHDRGDLVGMVTATAADAPAAVIPMAVVRAIADEIIDFGTADHARLAVRARTSTATEEGGTAGSLITAVTPDGPAARAGLAAGDLLVRIDEATIESMESMVAVLRRYEPGDTVEIVVIRGALPITVAVELDSHAGHSA